MRALFDAFLSFWLFGLFLWGVGAIAYARADIGALLANGHALIAGAVVFIALAWVRGKVRG